MAVCVNIGLDLGSDALKIAYAFQKQNGEVEYGKFSVSDAITQVAVPAVAYYDELARKWLFADEVDRSSSTSFITVVKIKTLISLLQRVADPKVSERNAEYYRSGHDFPKFYFPVRRKVSDDFDASVRADRTFKAEGTPQSVCESFFAYVAKKVNKRIAALAKSRGFTDYTVRLATVYPPRVGREYVQEFGRLASGAFGTEVFKELSSTKALGMFARHRGALRKNDYVLVFDLGEEDISVARVGLVGDAVVIDGADGHSEPLAFGGRDVDEAIEQYIEDGISECETMGTPSAPSGGHIRERGLHSRQYLFMKEIKKAKTILSRNLAEGSLFESGVPVSVSRSLYIQRSIDRSMLMGCLGTSTGIGVANVVVRYISDEIKLPVNRGVKKIFLSGGLTETYSLLDYVRAKLASDPRTCFVEICTFDDGREDDDGFTILSNEDSVYAPAVGGAIVALFDMDVKTALALSYGTWGYKDGRKLLIPFADKGELLDPDGAKEFLTVPFKITGARVEDEEIFSYALSAADIRDKAVDGLEYYTDKGGRVYLVVGEPNGSAASKAARKKCRELAGLKTVAGGVGSGIIFRHHGRRIKLMEEAATARVFFKEGISVDADGRAKPILVNVSEEFRPTPVTYMKGGDADWDVRGIYAHEIEFTFEGVEAFDATEGD